MAKLMRYLVMAMVLLGLMTSGVEASEEEVLKAKVVAIEEFGERKIDVYGSEQINPYQIVRIKLLEGSEAGSEVLVDHGSRFTISERQRVEEGEMVVVNRSELEDGVVEYQIIDKYRLDRIYGMVIAFLVLVLFMSRWKGLGSILGMAVSLVVILKLVVPQILAGRDPLLVSVVGSLIILMTSIYLAHGLTKQTTIAVTATFITLIIASVLAVLSVNLINLSGLGSDEAYSLQFGATAVINFRGLLLGGMIIGFLGVLDDVTTGLVATVFELATHGKLSFSKLVKSAMKVGQEHIASLVNTLILAYAGSSLPVFLFIVLNPQETPLWFVINSEMIAEEIVRTLVGSAGLLLAVPITAVMAAWVATRKAK